MIANPSALSPIIRDMRHGDLARVAMLERQCYEFPWSSGIFRDCLLAGYTSMVAEYRGEVVGYAIMSIAAGEAHLLNLCVAPALRRNGYGRRLLGLVIEQALRYGAERILLEVRPSNEAALALYASEGFEKVGLRKRYYRARFGAEDAVLLARRLEHRQRSG